MSESHQTFPHAEQAEQAVLSVFLQDPAAMGAKCAERKVTAPWFHFPGRALLFGILMDRWANQEACDLVTLTTVLHSMKKLDEVGGAAALAELQTYWPTHADADQHLDLLREKWIARELIRACAAASRAASGSEEIEKIVAAHVDIVAGLLSSAAKGYISMKARVLDKMNRMQEDEADQHLIRTGIGKLDRMSPMRRGDMPVLTGERKAGKSMLAISIMRNVLAAGGAGFYASLEQPDDEQVDRLLHGWAKIPTRKDHVSKLNQGELDRFTRITEAADWRFDLRDDVYDIGSILSALRQAKARWPDLHLAIVDYAQLVQGIRLKGDTREMEVASVSRMLRRAAGELDCALILLCQVNKGGEARESMAIEQDMTAMWKLSSPDEEEGEDGEDGDASQVRILSIPRQRNGRSGIGFKVAFQGHLGTVCELENEESA